MMHRRCPYLLAYRPPEIAQSNAKGGNQRDFGIDRGAEGKDTLGYAVEIAIILKTAVEMLGQAASLVQHGLQRFEVKDGAVGAKLLKPLPFMDFSLPAVVN